MKSKGIAVLLASVITVGTIGGMVFADNLNAGTQKDGQQAATKLDNNTTLLKSVKSDEQVQVSEPGDQGSGYNSPCNFSSSGSKNMVDIMKENGFEDAARYMQTGDYDKMNEFMSSLTEEDYQKMIDIMKENGYDSMAQMMQFIGREGMVQMHNSMYSTSSQNFGMMGGFGPTVR